MSCPLEATVRADGGTAHVVLVGRLDRDGDDAMAAAYDAVRGLGSTAVVLDFGATGYINSTGIALIVRLLAEARRDGRSVRATGLTEHYLEIFRITRLSDFMDLDGAGSNQQAQHGDVP